MNSNEVAALELYRWERGKHSSLVDSIVLLTCGSFALVTSTKDDPFGDYYSCVVPIEPDQVPIIRTALDERSTH